MDTQDRRFQAPLGKLQASIVVRVDRVYGNLVTYPVCERAQLLAEMTGTKTLTSKTLALAERMGFQIVQAPMAVLA